MVNNKLQAISSAAEIAAAKVNFPEKVQNQIERILAISRKTGELSNLLWEFAREDSEPSERIPIFNCIAEIAEEFEARNRIGIFLELNDLWTFDDEALDLADTKSKGSRNPQRGVDASDFDEFRLFPFGFGLRINTKSAFVPVSVVCDSLLIPTTLIPDESGTYAANVNPDATQPVDVYWDFDDGTTVSGRGPHRHSFANPGPDEKTYNVRVTASNSKSTSTAVCPVLILAPPACTIAATPPRLDTCQQPLPPVQFSSTVTGTTPITYRWDFGEPGATSTETNPSYTYTRDDVEPTMLTREATLRVSNAAGSALCTAQVNIAQCPCNPDLILGTSCFARHESVLPAGQARQNLQDNLAILQANPLTLIVVAGFAQPNERNAQALADSRADAVAQFYIDNGINPSRIVKIGLVELEGAKTGPVCTQTRPFCDRVELDRHLEEQRQRYQQQDK